MKESFTADSPGIATPGAAAHAAGHATPTRFNVLGAISFSHFLNDMMQSLIVAIYPLLKGEFHLSFVQIGVITLTYQICASVLQPLIGIYTDQHPAVFAQRRHGFYLHRHADSSVCAELRERVGRRRVDRRGLLDLSSGILANRPPGFGGPSSAR